MTYCVAIKIEDGLDPRSVEKADILKMQLGEAIKNYYAEELTEANRHRSSTIKNIKAICILTIHSSKKN